MHPLRKEGVQRVPNYFPLDFIMGSILHFRKYFMSSFSFWERHQPLDRFFLCLYALFGFLLLVEGFPLGVRFPFPVMAVFSIFVGFRSQGSSHPGWGSMIRDRVFT